jgi:hypothetical protein
MSLRGQETVRLPTALSIREAAQAIAQGPTALPVVQGSLGGPDLFAYSIAFHQRVPAPDARDTQLQSDRWDLHVQP